jgi:prepilin-type N-terminal cleavage/methylation domain-containing protein
LFKRIKGQAGFTLIELLVVVAILGVMTAIVTPNLINFLNAGNEEALAANTASVQVAADAFMVETGAPLPAWDIDFGDLVPTYLRATPTPGTFTIDANGIVKGE